MRPEIEPFGPFLNPTLSHFLPIAFYLRLSLNMNTNVISKIVLESEIKDLQKYYQIFFVSLILMAVPIARYIGKLIDDF